jgi:xanthine permease XanP
LTKPVAPKRLRAARRRNRAVRYIGFAAGGLFVLLGFSPKLGALLSIMPAPVQGAIVVFVTCFMVMSGLQIILTSKPDTRTTFVICTALVFGFSLDIVPDLYAQVPAWLRPLFDSSLTLATVVAVALNQLLRWGAGQPAAASQKSAPADRQLVAD